jgi:hypothetical protein
VNSVTSVDVLLALKDTAVKSLDVHADAAHTKFDKLADKSAFGQLLKGTLATIAPQTPTGT